MSVGSEPAAASPSPWRKSLATLQANAAALASGARYLFNAALD